MDTDPDLYPLCDTLFTGHFRKEYYEKTPILLTILFIILLNSCAATSISAPTEAKTSTPSEVPFTPTTPPTATSTPRPRVKAGDVRRVELSHLENWMKKNLTRQDEVVLEMTTNTWQLYDELVEHAGSVMVVHPPHMALITRSQVTPAPTAGAV